MDSIKQQKSEIPAQFQIRVGGILDTQWQGYFESMDFIENEVGSTDMVGPIIDQAMLFGYLRKIRDLGLTIIAVINLDDFQVDAEKKTQSN